MRNRGKARLRGGGSSLPLLRQLPPSHPPSLATPPPTLPHSTLPPPPSPSPTRKSDLPDLRKYRCATGVNPVARGRERVGRSPPSTPPVTLSPASSQKSGPNYARTPSTGAKSPARTRS